MAIKQTKVPITSRALTQRINRALADRREVLKASRGDTQRRELGRYYILGMHSHLIVQRRIDLEQLARKLKVLQPYERLANSAARIGNILRSAKRQATRTGRRPP